ncbi:MAG: hypothetical protein JXA69_20430, partial [Phycisphaerae bacterium]|nr:hypothetical protein [Phycisphaerae bacterium]
WEWNEAVIEDVSGPCRGLRGGSFGDYFGVYGLHASMRVAYSPGNESSVVGFRLAEAPGTASCSADFDGDSDVDLADFALFTACFNGPNRSPTTVCAADADLDGDGDADLADFGILSACFNGPNRPPRCE